MRYIPKGIKLCFLINFINHLMTNKETTKATRHPTSKKIASYSPIMPYFIKNLTPLRIEAPNMTGIDKKKENSALALREQDKSMAPKIVTPLLDVPGIKARSCMAPIIKAYL